MRICLALDWGAVFVATSHLRRRQAQAVVLHHSASANRSVPTDPVQERGQAFAWARGVQDFHRRRRRWVDTGYNFLVSRGGVVMEGRQGSYRAAESGLVVQGAHAGVRSVNETMWGVALEGTYTNEVPTREQWAALVDLLAWLSFKGNTQARDIFGHRDFKPTECPGGKMYEILKELGEQVRERKLALMREGG